ncbi:MAG: EF-P lysine aminoacylase GenX [Desulfobacteraceae bacterium IS3]|nr:MAG: EF-P lysine aminoacylase GenX [Desulfobacteraceae bacterium IS3]
MKSIYYRQSSVEQNLRRRAEIIQSIRRFFTERDYLEVETPCRIPAPAPESHIDAAPAGDWFLQTSPELCMKRLLSAGYARIFQICRCFRQKERGEKHLPEFTMLEWYCANVGYRELMEECEDLIGFAAREIGFGEEFEYQGEKIDLSKPWQRMSVKEAFETFASVSAETALSEDRFDEVVAFEIEPHLGRGKPLFLYDYPAQCGALARLKPENPGLAERFELYICGMELCNAFSELTDPAEQRMRFEKELKFRSESGKIAYPMPEKFLECLRDMPQASGNALGIERLVMLFTDSAQIDDVTAFTPEEL